MSEIIKDGDYRNWLIGLKNRIKTSQIKAALSVNSELIRLYWDIGRQITEIQKNSQYGDGIIKQVATDLKKEFPDMGGFSHSNLKYCKQFYQFWQPVSISQQTVGDAPAIGILLCKTKDNLNVEFALRDINKPIGVSEFTFNELPQQIQNSMPTVEELEYELFTNNTDDE